MRPEPALGIDYYIRLVRRTRRAARIRYHVTTAVYFLFMTANLILACKLAEAIQP